MAGTTIKRYLNDALGRLGFSLSRRAPKQKKVNPLAINFDITGPSGLGKTTLMNAFCARSPLGYSPVNRVVERLSAKDFKRFAQPWHYAFFQNQVDIYEASDKPAPWRLHYLRWAMQSIETDIVYNYMLSGCGYVLEAGLFLNGSRALPKLNDDQFSQAFKGRRVVFVGSDDPGFVLHNIKRRKADTGRLSSNHQVASNDELLKVVEAKLNAQRRTFQRFRQRGLESAIYLNSENGLASNVEEIQSFVTADGGG